MSNVGKAYYYIIAAMPSIIAAEQYIPTSEINIILKCLILLEQKNRSRFDFEIYWTLLQSVLCLTDLAIHRNPSEEATFLETLNHGLNIISSDVLRRSSQYKLKRKSIKPSKPITKSSKSTQLFLERIGASETSFLSTKNNVLTETELLIILSIVLPDFDAQEEKIRCFIDMQKQIDLKEEELQPFLVYVMSNYFQSIENMDRDWQDTDDALYTLDRILLIIGTLFSNAVNQRTFYRVFLTVHQQCLLELGESLHEFRQLSVLNYLAIFTQSIPLEELLHFIEQHWPISNQQWNRCGLQIDKKLLCENNFWHVFDNPNNRQTLSSVYIKILGNDLALAHKTQLNDYVGNVPILMHLLPTITRNAFYEFYAKASTVNMNAIEAQRINFPFYLMINYSTISNFLHLMGADGVAAMKKKIAGTLLSLVRFCNNLPQLLPVTSMESFVIYYQTYRSLIFSSPKEGQAWCHLLMMLHFFSNIKDEESESFFCENIVLDILLQPSDVAFTWSKIILLGIFGNEESNYEEVSVDIDRLARIAALDHLPKFVMAYSQLKYKIEFDIYKQLLRCDLSGESVNDLLHNLRQDNKLGVSLALHNKHIRDTLINHGIHPNAALDYKKTNEIIFSAEGDNSSSYTNNLFALWSYAKKLSFLATIELSKVSIGVDDKKLIIMNSLRRIITAVSALEEHAFDNVRMTTRRLSTEKSCQLFAKIMKSLVTLKNSSADCSSEFNKLSDHYSQQHLIFSNLKMSYSTTKKRAKPYYFRIMQWSKSHPMTFLLGDDVGCCLSTTGAQFRAMLYRRIDDAMLFHVAVNMETGKPAALIWLYLAETNHGTVSLIANFVEVNAKYAENNQLRKALLQSLLSFTHQYCLDNPKIDEFYMTPLTYGWNITDLEIYPQITISFKDKVGGSIIHEDTSRDRTINTYHLASLYCDEFHKFDPLILEHTKVSGCYQLDSILNDWINELMPNTLEKIQRIIIERHPLELLPFFSTPLEDDAKLKLMIRTAYERYIDKNESSRKSEAPLLVKFGHFQSKETVVDHKSLDIQHEFRT